MAYHKGRTIYIVDCERCDGSGEVEVCAFGHLVAADGFCEACYEIAGKWEGTRCAHGMVHACVTCDADVIDPVPSASAAVNAEAA